MNAFEATAKRFKKIDVFGILREITKQSDVQRWVKDTIKNRIQRTGIDANNNKLKTDSPFPEPYSFYTSLIKGRKSGIASIATHVTLTDTGDFWRSFKITLIEDGFRTSADFQKSGGNIHDNFTQDYPNKKDFEDAVLGLSESELNEIVSKYYYPRFIKKINEILSK